jgi:hypothetical protein
MMFISSALISGACATPLTRPLLSLMEFVHSLQTHALLTRTSMSFHSSGSFAKKPLTSSGLLTSNCTVSTLTPDPTSFSNSDLILFRVSRRRAARMSFKLLGDVRANSKAVLRPMPEEAPVMRMVLPERRLDIDEDMVVGVGEKYRIVCGVTRGYRRRWRVEEGGKSLWYGVLLLMDLLRVNMKL